jgi:type IV pilus assembly protein PilE
MRANSGLSLIELMITLVIIGILAAITVPSYSHHYARAKRLEAEMQLIKLSAALEQYFFDNNTYLGATLENLNFPVEIASQRYQLAINTLSGTYFEIEASPLIADEACAALKMNSRGEKNSGGTGNIADCW